MAHIKICKEEGCHNAATTRGYCRLHYLRNWKRIKDETRRRGAKKLNRYIEHVMKNHPDRYVEVIKKEIREPGFERYVEENFGFDAVGRRMDSVYRSVLAAYGVARS